MWPNTLLGALTLIILAVIVFVRAGQISGVSGADQSATIVKAAAGGSSQIINSLTGAPAAPASSYYG